MTAAVNERIEVRTVDALFARTVLREWDNFELDEWDYASARALALYAALGADRNDDEYTLCLHRDGLRWALIGMIVEGHRYAIEVQP